MTTRARLPHRRQTVTQGIESRGMRMELSAGFDPKDGALREMFVGGIKDGSLLDAIMGDVAVIVSVALQHGVPIEAMGHSVARIPAYPISPDDLDHAPSATIPASPVGAALDWLMEVDHDRQ